MRYSYESKKECVELYKQGKWMEVPEGVNQHMFRDNICYWSKLVDFHGEENEYLRTVQAVEKKLDALRREKYAAYLKAKKQQSSEH